MKKVILSLCATVLALLGTTSLYAVVAYPHPVEVKQADGTYITIQMQGDEYFHYAATADGYPLIQIDGIYFHANVSSDGVLSSTGVKANNINARTAEEMRILAMKPKGVPSGAVQAARAKAMGAMNVVPQLDFSFPSKGDVKTIAILVNFTDTKFTIDNPKESFERILNEEGYSDQQSTGSVRDYYKENSHGEFRLTFDVYGPYDMSESMAYYGKNDPSFGGSDGKTAALLVKEACEAADKDIDYTQYDYNNDGKVDNIFIVYAGLNEAEGGPANSIWPHRWDFGNAGMSCVLDGKQIYDYACTSELRGSDASKKIKANIGTFTHEFGHVLGLPDFYDTDGSTNGYSDGVDIWSLMNTGSYNNESRTPPYLSGTERYLLGWLEPKLLEYSGEYTLKSIGSANEAFMVKTSKDNEFFMLENRQLEGWDSYLPGHGLLIFHVDRSTNAVGFYTAAQTWERNSVNNNTEHECYRIIPARKGATASTNEYMPFPGKGGFTEFSKDTDPANVDWSKKNIDAELFEISEDNGVISFRAKTSKEEVFPVTDMEISCNRNQLIINDTLKINTHFTPWNATNKNVNWTSSDPSVAEVDANGAVTGMGTGSATITGVSEDGNITKTFDITVKEGQLLRAQVLNTAGSSVNNVNVKISVGGKEYEATTDGYGFISIEGIPEGKGTVTVKHDDYPEQSKELNVIKNASLFRYRILTRTELSRGYEAFKVNVNAYETSAYLSWPESDGKKWIVKWYKEGDDKNAQSEEVTVKKFDIEGLQKETNYVVEVSEFSDVIAGDVTKKEFTTTAPSGEFATMLFKTAYTKGETILLKAGNLPEGAETTWKVDGTEYTETELVLTNAEYKIELFIKTAEGTEVITRYIQVMEEEQPATVK